MPLLLLIALPLLMLWLGVHAASWAKRLAARHQTKEVIYPTAEVLEATFEAEPEGVWPPKPAAESLEQSPGHEWPG